ncbi:MAG: UDP-N-acetylglucosamine--N-acetylmuramyl-(pentapeptide) pyrophosphoryl-undecaprenol N-acetylglucosamine transferase [Candidatus Paceibacterota bacterium]
MKILFTGGGSGGHFYPIVAVAQEIRKIMKEHKLLDADMYYMGPTSYNPSILFDNNIIYKRVSAGKIRLYFSLLNLTDSIKTIWGIIQAFVKVFQIYPDIVFSKGGYASFPVLLAARFFRIPIIIHESDSIPGRVNIWAGKFANKIAVSYPSAISYFPKEKVAYTGNPVRAEIIRPSKNGAYEFLKLEQDVPVILVLGGSQGAKIINDIIVDALPRLLPNYQIIHQTGKNNLEEVNGRARIVLDNNQYSERYKTFGYLNDLAMKMAAGVATLVISRGGSTIFEIALWGLPSIIIPITESNGDHQRKNAYNYARSGACIVVEESNLNVNIFTAEIERLMESSVDRDKMAKSAKEFARADSAKIIATEILGMALTHEGK